MKGSYLLDEELIIKSRLHIFNCIKKQFAWKLDPIKAQIVSYPVAGLSVCVFIRE